jgi:hypothetical protein
VAPVSTQAKRTIVRVGGQCQSAALVPYILRNQRTNLQRGTELNRLVNELRNQRARIEKEMEVGWRRLGVQHWDVVYSWLLTDHTLPTCVCYV